jgi:hypothetical protein
MGLALFLSILKGQGPRTCLIHIRALGHDDHSGPQQQHVESAVENRHRASNTRIVERMIPLAGKAVSIDKKLNRNFATHEAR